MKETQPINNIECDHPLDKRRYGLRGGICLEGGDIVDTITPYDFNFFF